MSLRPFVPWLVVAGLLAGACDRNARERAEPTYRLPATRGVLEVPPTEMLSAIRDEPGLRPDCRFLLAVIEVDRLLTGRRPGELEVEYRGSRWSLRYRGRVAGTLPKAPDFSDAIAMLEAHARRTADDSGSRARSGVSTAKLDSIETTLGEFHASRVMDGLRGLDEAWRSSGGDPRLLPFAARGLIYLQLQSWDRLDLADSLGAKALATLALARALTNEDMAREEALLADGLGYARYARSVADSWPDTDLIRPYLRTQDGLLRQFAERPDADRLTRYLYIDRLAWRGDREEWGEWIARYALDPKLSTPILKTGFSLDSFELIRVMMPIYPHLVLLELWSAMGMDPLEGTGTAFDGRHERDLRTAVDAIHERVGWDASDLAHRLEADLERVPDVYPGPFLDASTLRAYFAGHFYASIYTLAIHWLGFARRATEFAQGLEGSPAGVADDLHRRYVHMVDSEAGREDTGAIVRDVQRLDHLGENAWMRLFEVINERRRRYEEVVRFETAERLGRRLDTRPEHQFSYARLSRARYDLAGAERHFRNVILLAGPHYENARAWMARFVGDTASLRAMIEDNVATLEARTEALEYLMEDRLAGDDYIRRWASALIANDPDRWETRAVYIRYLEDAGAYRDALPVVEEWLEDHDRSDGFPYIFARTARARLLYRLGQFDLALQSVDPVVISGQAGAMGRAALIHQRMGHSMEALGLARRLVDRYPNLVFARAVLAQVLWDQGRYEDVAGVLHNPRHPLQSWEWGREVVDAFLEVFGERSLQEAGEAFDAIVAAGVPSWISEPLPEGLHREGRHDLAFTLQSRLEATRAIGSLRNPMRAYLYLADWKGQKEALEWIRPRIPSRVLGEATVVMFQEDAGALMWDLIPDPEKTAYPAGVWAMRAAAFVRSGEKDPPRERALRGYFVKPSDDRFHAIGRYLMGLDARDDLLARAKTAESRCEIAYYIGLKAESEGDYVEAADWYRIVLETGQDQEYEHAWASSTLSNWIVRDRSLAYLAATGGGP